METQADKIKSQAKSRAELLFLCQRYCKSGCIDRGEWTFIFPDKSSLVILAESPINNGTLQAPKPITTEQMIEELMHLSQMLCSDGHEGEKIVDNLIKRLKVS